MLKNVHGRAEQFEPFSCEMNNLDEYTKRKKRIVEDEIKRSILSLSVFCWLEFRLPALCIHFVSNEMGTLLCFFWLGSVCLSKNVSLW